VLAAFCGDCWWAIAVFAVIAVSSRLPDVVVWRAGTVLRATACDGAADQFAAPARV